MDPMPPAPGAMVPSSSVKSCDIHCKNCNRLFQIHTKPWPITGSSEMITITPKDTHTSSRLRFLNCYGGFRSASSMAV